MGMQVPHCLDPQVQEEVVVRPASNVPWAGIQGFGAQPRERGERHLSSDHVHMLISIPPKYSVAQVTGYIKGKSAIHIARNYMGQKRNFTGHQFWARGYYVSTVGRDEKAVREYIKTQEEEDRRLDQLNLFT
jgi:hypothetical protein